MVATPCGFDSHLRYKEKASTKSGLSFFEIAMNACIQTQAKNMEDSETGLFLVSHPSKELPSSAQAGRGESHLRYF